MTIKEAIQRTDEQKPNQYTDEDKIYWLSQLDGTIKKEIIDTHEGAEDASFTVDYNEEYDLNRDGIVNLMDAKQAIANGDEDLGQKILNIIASNIGETVEAYTADTELLVAYPYDDIYIHWLCARIDYANSESDKYENSMIMFNSAYQQYAAFYNRTHKPLQNQFKV